MVADGASVVVVAPVRHRPRRLAELHAAGRLADRRCFHAEVASQ